MRRLIIYLFFVLAYIFVFRQEAQATEFTKFSENPLTISYELNYSEHLQAHIFKNNSKYLGILTAKRTNESYYSIVLIESSDGIQWKMIKEILNLGKDISSARLFVEDNGIKRILISQMDAKDFYRIYSIECDDYFNCDQTPELVLDPEKSNSNESHGYVAPHVVRINTTNFLFYSRWGNSGFNVTMAHSDTYGDWEKCNTNIVSDADGPFVFTEGEFIYLLAHRSAGIYLLRTNKSTLNCQSTWEILGYILTKSKPYDQNQIVFPSLINSGEYMTLFYTGKGTENIWRLSMAFGQINDNLPSPTNTPTPTLSEAPTPTLTPTPTFEVKKSIVLVPGMLASWNKNAILHNQKIDQSLWKLSPFVKEYDALINSLKNYGYEINTNLYIFSYDWRLSLEDSATSLKEYLTRLGIINKPYMIIGHSLGGLVARIYQQKHNDSNLERLITVGTPHYGAVQAYKAVQAGDLEQDNSWVWLTQNIILNLYRNNLKTNKQIIEENFLVIYDLLPIFNYIKNIDGHEVDLSSMHIKNNFLLDNSAENLKNADWLQSIVGENIDSLGAYKVGERSILDKLLGNYIDGRPISEYFESGDGLIIARSSNISNQSMFFNLNHGELIYDRNSIKTILKELNMPIYENKILQGAGTKITPSIIFIIKSPATLEVEYANTRYHESEGIIFIENAQSGEYVLKVNGLEIGNYEVLVGEIGNTSSSWNSIKGSIKSIIPQLETDTYRIDFNNESPEPYFFTKGSLNNIIDDIFKELAKDYRKHFVEIFKLNKIKFFINKNKLSVAKELIFNLNRDFSNRRDYILIEKLESVYSLAMKDQLTNNHYLKSKFKTLSDKYYKSQVKIINKRGYKIQGSEKILLENISKKIILAGQNIKTNRFIALEVILVSIENLLNKL